MSIIVNIGVNTRVLSVRMRWLVILTSVYLCGFCLKTHQADVYLSGDGRADVKTIEMIKLQRSKSINQDE